MKFKNGVAGHLRAHTRNAEAVPRSSKKSLSSRIGKLDIKEFSRKIANEKGKGAGFGVEIGEGDCDWPAVLAALKEIGYSGWATAEVGGGDLTRLTEISQRMDKHVIQPYSA